MADNKEYALEIKNLHKHFKLPTEKASTLKGLAINRLRGIKGYKKQQVLRGIDFKVEKGEFLGIVGRNGSGKSTLLKIISEIYQPSRGKIHVNGRLVPFIELGVGFNPELTGRENVYLNGAMLGFSNTEVDAMYNEIVDFAEIHDFMDQKLKNYSSGMQVRLAFSVAIRAKSDILVLDEVLAVGDEAFQRKCFAYFAKQKEERRTIILVTHSMDVVRQFCTRAIMIEDGNIAYDGDADSIANAYTKANIVGPARPHKEPDSLQLTAISGQIVTNSDDIRMQVSISHVPDDAQYVILSVSDDTSGMLLLRTQHDITKSGRLSYTLPSHPYNNINIVCRAALVDSDGNTFASTNDSEPLRFAIRRPANNREKGLLSASYEDAGRWGRA